MVKRITKQKFQEHLRKQAEINNALIEAIQSFATFVKKYDGKVCNCKLFNEYNESGFRTQSLVGYYYAKASKPTSGDDYQHTEAYISLSGKRKNTHIGDPNYVQDEYLTDNLNDFRATVYFGGVPSYKYYKPEESMVNPDNRISYEQFKKLAFAKCKDLEDGIRYLWDLHDKVDQYEALYHEATKFLNDVVAALPYELRQYSEITKTSYTTLFEEPRNYK